ncbi:MAG: hypothetical protein AAF551_10930, partial [Bacteroidota bacterium]
MFKFHHILLYPLLLVASFGLSASSGSISFIENKGQWGDEIKYLAHIPGGSLLVYQDKLVYHFAPDRQSGHAHPHGPHLRTRRKKNSKTVSITFDEINRGAKLTGLEDKGYQHNYYLGNDRSRYASECHVYGAVQLTNLYQGIDLKLYSRNGNLKYDMIVKEQADPSKIKLTYSGDFHMYLEDGCSFIDLGRSTWMENRPFAYQTGDEGMISEVSCHYRLTDQTIAFELGNTYDASKELVIDPELIFSTFSGAVSDNFGYSACFDDDGNLYSGGIVFGSRFPSSIGSFGGGEIDMGILKYDSSGSQLLYATFIGGSNNESPHSMIVNHANELVILGTTGSVDYPTSVGSYDDSFNGGTAFEIFGTYNQGSDLTLTKLDDQGRLIASTFIGGPGNDGILKMTAIDNYQNELIYNYGDFQRGDIIVDDLDNVYVASSTDNTGFPVTSSIQPAYNGGNSDALVFSLDSDLANLRWSTYFGGTADDAAYSIKLDDLDQIIIGGGTSSSDLPTTSGVHKETYSGSRDGFLSIFNVPGDSIVASTYMGTADYDQVFFIDIDDTQNIYATGQTSGAYPVTAGAYSNPNSSQFIHKLD